MTTRHDVYIGDTRVFRATLALATGAVLDLSTTKIKATISRNGVVAATLGNTLAGLTGIVAVAPAATSMMADITITEAQTALLVPAGATWTLEAVVEGADGFEHTVDDHPELFSKTRATSAII